MNGSPPPLVVVTLSARSLGEARAQVEEAAGAGADATEVRFDLWPMTSWPQMPGLFPSKLPLMATLRSRAEGGEGPDQPEIRRRWHDEVARLPFAWVDHEVARDFGGVSPGPELPAARTVRSVHLPRGTAAPDAHRILSRLSEEPGIVKAVLPATVEQLLFELLPQLPPPGEGRFVVHTTGPSGPLLRAWSRRFGFALVFASLPEAPGRPPVEPAQIPVDRLKPFLVTDPSPPLFAVVGRPIGQSLSPALHHRWMKAEGRAGLYVALELETDAELVRSVPALVRGGFRGFNVTHPFKETVLGLADTQTARAQECGCANVLTIEPSGIEADNTDLYAILRRLRELESAGRWDGSDLLIVGAGGAARAALAAARSLGIRPRLLARDSARAARVAKSFAADLADPSSARVSGMIVHATPAGSSGSDALAVDLASWMGSRSFLLDFVYGSRTGEMRRLCERTGAAYEDGRRLLAYSAAASYERWWGSNLSSSQVLDGVSEES